MNYIFENPNLKSIIMNLKITFLLKTIIVIVFADNYCNIPDKCNILKSHDLIADKKYISCLIQIGSKVGFKKSVTNDTYKTLNETYKTYKSLNETIFEVFFKTSRYNPSKFHKNVVDFKEFLESFILNNSYGFTQLEFHSFKGFDIDLFDLDQNDISYINFTHRIDLVCVECVFEFYKDEKQIETCEEMNKAVGLNGPKSIFQIPSSFLNPIGIQLILSEYKTKICPLAFKNFYTEDLYIVGYNSFYSRRVLIFSNETSSFSNLNSKVNSLLINIPNVDIDLNFINPSIFRNLLSLELMTKVNSIQSDLFMKMRNISKISIEYEYFRSLIHKQGIEWIKNINNELKVNINDSNDLKRNFHHIKYINIQVNNVINKISLTDSIAVIFPEEDFCLYKDYPFYQLVYIINTKTASLEYSSEIKFACTFLFLIQYY